MILFATGLSSKAHRRTDVHSIEHSTAAVIKQKLTNKHMPSQISQCY